MRKIAAISIMTALVLMLGAYQITWAGCGACGGGAKHTHDKATSSKMVCGCPASEASMQAHQKMNVLETAEHAGSFNTLLSAIKKAGLESTLKGDGPYTVFAPTDEAFANLPKGKLDALLKDKAKLKSILTYHVHSGLLTSNQVANLSSFSTVNGQDASVMVEPCGVMIDHASIVTPDVKASNGIIHIIDHVNLPKALTTLMDE